MKTKHAGGRPKRTTKDFPANWKEMIINQMSQGASKEELILVLGLGHDTFYRLKKEDKEFQDAIKKGEELCKAWWMNVGRINMVNKNFSPVLWYMNMKNRFGWKDKSETDVTSNGKQIIGFTYQKPKEENGTDKANN